MYGSVLLIFIIPLKTVNLNNNLFALKNNNPTRFGFEKWTAFIENTKKNTLDTSNLVCIFNGLKQQGVETIMIKYRQIEINGRAKIILNVKKSNLLPKIQKMGKLSTVTAGGGVEWWWNSVKLKWMSLSPINGFSSWLNSLFTKSWGSINIF